jgi:hypothetical protein
MEVDSTYFSGALDILSVAGNETGLVWCGRHDVMWDKVVWLRRFVSFKLMFVL